MKAGGKLSLIAIFLLSLTVPIVGCGEKNVDIEKINIPEKSKSQKPPKELKLSSVLYRLAVASDRESFAKKHSIFLSEGEVRVFIFLNPDFSNSERRKLIKDYNMTVEKRSNDLLRVLVLVDNLIPLSKGPIIKSISLPDKLKPLH